LIYIIELIRAAQWTASARDARLLAKLILSERRERLNSRLLARGRPIHDVERVQGRDDGLGSGRLGPPQSCPRWRRLGAGAG
jgi:hypothetical protein